MSDQKKSSQPEDISDQDADKVIGGSERDTVGRDTEAERKKAMTSEQAPKVPGIEGSDIGSGG